MATRRVCLHLGAHKTATSLIQGYLDQESHPGWAAGIRHFPRGETARRIGWGQKLIDQPAGLALRIGEEASRRDAEVVFLSHEDALGRPFGRGPSLYHRAAPNLEALARVVADYEVELILSIRPQAQFIESYYLQRVQEGTSLSFKQWRKDLSPTDLSWRPVVETLLRHFPRAPLTIVDFRSVRLGQEAFIANFLEQVRPEHGLDTHYEFRHNTSISAKGLAIQLAANTVLTTPAERRHVRLFLQRNFSNLQHPRPKLFSEAEVRAIEERYGADYEDLVKTFAKKTRGPFS